jgi:hypothetical protein
MGDVIPVFLLKKNKKKEQKGEERLGYGALPAAVGQPRTPYREPHD